MNRASSEAMVGDHGKGASEGSAASRHGALAVLALIALSAYGGALGLITGLLNLGSTVARRLPFHSPVSRRPGPDCRRRGAGYLAGLAGGTGPAWGRGFVDPDGGAASRLDPG